MTNETTFKMPMTFEDSVDHLKDIPATERTGSIQYTMAMLCRQDKEQLDRIEALLKTLLEKHENTSFGHF